MRCQRSSQTKVHESSLYTQLNNQDELRLTSIGIEKSIYLCQRELFHIIMMNVNEFESYDWCRGFTWSLEFKDNG